MPGKIGKGLLVLAFVVLAAVCVMREVSRNRFELPYGRLLGDNWLRMTTAEKVYFVEGYQRGNSAGHADACALFGPLDPKRFPPVPGPAGILQDPCLARGRSWSRGAGDVVEQIDAFYARYPQDRNVHLESLIELLSDQRGMSIEQIHGLGRPSRVPVDAPPTSPPTR